MGFSKQFEAQMVLEWKDAFVDYKHNKKELKKIMLLNTNLTSSKQCKNNSFPNSILSSLGKISCFGRKKDLGTIQVHRKQASSANRGDLYETELLEQFADVQGAGEFFASLDHDLNKVNQFYKTKEKEFLERGESLKQQLDILLQLKNALQQNGDNKDDPSISCHISCGKH